jgi:hypothetical protein
MQNMANALPRQPSKRIVATKTKTSPGQQKCPQTLHKFLLFVVVHGDNSTVVFQVCPLLLTRRQQLAIFPDATGDGRMCSNLPHGNVSTSWNSEYMQIAHVSKTKSSIYG